MSKFSIRLSQQVHPLGITFGQLSNMLGAKRAGPVTVFSNHVPDWVIKRLVGWMELRALDTVPTITPAILEKKVFRMDMIEKEENKARLAKFIAELLVEEFHEKNSKVTK